MSAVNRGVWRGSDAVWLAQFDGLLFNLKVSLLGRQDVWAAECGVYLNFNSLILNENILTKLSKLSHSTKT